MVASSNPNTSQHDSDATTGQTPRYAAFNSTKVLVCGYPADDVKALARAIEAEGGKVLTKLHRGASPHVIVAGTVVDPVLKDARKLLQYDIPTVTRAWVEECIKQKAQVEVRLYRLQPLAGLQVTATNFSGTERAALEAQVRAAGGEYSAEMYKGKTTHLICKSGTGKKYSAALQWRNVHAVSEAWVRASAALGFPAPEEQYRVLPAPANQPRPAQTSSTGGAVHSNSAHAPAPLPGSALFGPAAAAAAGAASSKQASGGNAARQADSGLQQQPDDAGQQQATSSGRPQRGAAAAAAAAIEQAGAGASSRPRRSSQQQQQQQPDPGEADAAAAGAPAGLTRVNSAAARLAALGVADPDAAPMFLERVVLWWCGIPSGSGEHKELQTILHVYAGVRFPELCDSITHIMIGNSASVDELKAVQHFLAACKRRVEVVSPAWLQLCQQEQRLAPADGRCRLQLNSLVRLATGSGAASGAGGAGGGVGAGNSNNSSAGGSGGGGGGGVFANAASRGGPPGGDKGAAAEQQQGWVPEYWKAQPADPLRLFDGCYFTLAAVQSFQADHERALAHIRRLGGKVFTADSTKPPPGWPKVFAVCPASLPREAESGLMNGDASFRLVAPSCRVTLHWMELCIRRSELVRATSRNPLLAPLRFLVPIRDFAGVRVAVSGYTQEQRITIEKVVALLGGTYCSGSLSSSRKPLPTHLMLPRWGPDAPAADGEQQQQQANAASGTQQQQQQVPDSTLRKVVFAQKHRLEMVVSEWLLECAVEGRRVQEALYRPAGELQPHLLAAAGMAGGTQGGGGTQLPITQAPPGQQQLQQTQGLGSRQGSVSSAAGPVRLPHIPKPTQTQRPPAASAAAGDGSDGGSNLAAPPPKRSWFTANLVNSRQQQQQATAAASSRPAEAPAEAAALHQAADEQGAVTEAAEPLQEPHQPEAAVPPCQQQQPAAQEAACSPQSAAAVPAPQPSSPRSGGRKRGSAAAADRPASGNEPTSQGKQPSSSGGKRQRRQSQQQSQQQQQAERSQGDSQKAASSRRAGGGAAAPAAAHAKPLSASPLTDVANTLHAAGSPTLGPPPPAAAAECARPAQAATGHAGVAAAPAAELPPPPAPQPQVHGSHDDDAALEGVLTVLNTINSSKDPSLHGSQQLAGDMLHQLPDQLLSGLASAGGSGAAAGGGSGGSGGIVPAVAGGSVRSSKRRPSGLGSRSSSGNVAAGGGADADAGSGGDGSGAGSEGGAGTAAAPKRPRRGSAAAAAAARASLAAPSTDSGGAAAAGPKHGAMLPPARRPGGGALAAGADSGSNGQQQQDARGGAVRFSARRGGSSSSLQDLNPDFEPSQQVGYDVGDAPEALLAAGRAAAAAAAAAAGVRNGGSGSAAAGRPTRAGRSSSRLG